MYQRIVREYLDLGKSLNDISMDLNTEGVRTRNGCAIRWSSGTISRILKSADYLGEITVNKFLTDAKGKVVAHRPESEHIIFEAPPLITKDRWEELQRRLENANSRSGRPSRASQEFLLHGLCRCGICGAVMLAQYGTRRANGTRSRNYVCYWHKAGLKMREVKGREKCHMPLIPAELLEWQVFYVELMRQLGLEPEHYKLLLDGKNGLDSKIETLERKLSNVEASLRRKEIVLRNLDSLLERDDFDRAEYSHKRHGYLTEIHALHHKMENTRNELDGLRQRKTEKSEFARLISEADQIKDLAHSIMNLSFASKQRLLRGVLDGPVVVGHSTLVPHCDLENENALGEILKHTTMTIRHNQPLLLELLSDKHTTKSL